MSKPKIFIASSRENIETARAIQDAFDHDALVTTWDQDTFGPSEYPLESLDKELDKADFGVFVFFPDDVTVMRGEQLSTVRDNVIFELGLFVGRLTRRRTFILKPRGTDIHLPSDLSGITPVEYDHKREDDNLLAAVGPAARKIRKAMREMGTRLKADTAGLVEAEDRAIPANVEPSTSSYLIEPEPSWSRSRFERALMMAVFSDSKLDEEAVDSAFRRSPMANSDESIAIWEAWQIYAHMIAGEPGAINNIQEKVHAFPNSSRLLQLLGQALAHYGDKEAASHTFMSALTNASNIEAAQSSISKLVDIHQDTPELLDHAKLRAQLIAFPHTAPTDQKQFNGAMRSLAGYAGLKHIAQAIDEVRVKSAPDDGSLRFSLAHGYSENDPELSLLHYECIPNSERSGMVWNNLGVAYSALTMRGAAVAAYRIASEKGETIADGNLAHNLIHAGLFDDARKQAESAIKVPNHNENVVTALNTLSAAIAEEEKKAQQARVAASQKQAFFERLGRASLTSGERGIVGNWQTQDGTINFELVGGDRYVGTGEFKREVPNNSLIGLFAPQPNTRIETILVEVHLRRFGDAFEGTITRRSEDVSAYKTILGSFGRDNSVTIYLADDHILLGQINSYEKETISWRKVGESPLQIEVASA
ncbi:MAG: hypothetical protein EOS17_08050 [Mesorhizobium sp.]|uniref:nucleotide-binding protein n=1 Tax=Mesorhizobium sp. M7A.F.Ca.MR.176.00.0.0 TaxID=2496776 RepID=UPI000FD23406|nr:nucleotide-binding protein [Mesorhizobium sp. M7A.F.Ca.MR.176.00.0.0]RUU90440.1 hypothetical protein EOB59_15720 [Mesorhizobium sp. M7A.F.Ca.MR.176.00.0.0]RWO71091.1 MAG: hypothetical protein EOS17_08050 [Mesorhizobium sp.]